VSGQLDHVGHERLFVFSAFRIMSTSPRTTIRRYEGKLVTPEKDTALMLENLAKQARSRGGFGQTTRPRAAMPRKFSEATGEWRHRGPQICAETGLCGHSKDLLESGRKNSGNIFFFNALQRILENGVCYGG